MEKSIAFEAFYRDNYIKVLRFAERRISDREVAQEVCAEAFIVAWRKFDPDAPFELPWMYKTARNILGNTYRRRARERDVMGILRREVQIDAYTSPGRMIGDALSVLQPSEREVLQLTYWEGLSASEVGAVLGCSEQAAWKRVSRAKAALRAVLEETREMEPIGGGAS